jgi:hypothetical protein
MLFLLLDSLCDTGVCDVFEDEKEACFFFFFFVFGEVAVKAVIATTLPTNMPTFSDFLSSSK